MPRTRPAITLATVVLGVAVSVALGGCTPQTPTAPAEKAVPAASAPASSAATLVRMDPDQARSQIASNFPAEVPVVMGDKLQGKAQGDVAWDYELTVQAPASTVAEWYFAEYQRRSWSLVEQPAQADGSFRLTLRKGTAESQITVVPVSANTSKVSAILGVGTPVLETQ